MLPILSFLADSLGAQELRSVLSFLIDRHVLQSLLCGAGLALYHLSAIDDAQLKKVADDLRKLALRAVAEAIEKSEIPIKAYADMTPNVKGEPMDESQLRKQLRGEPGYNLSFIHMLTYWPWPFWYYFAPNLLWLMGKKRVQEMAAEFGVDLQRSA